MEVANAENVVGNLIDSFFMITEAVGNGLHCGSSQLGVDDDDEKVSLMLSYTISLYSLHTLSSTSILWPSSPITLESEVKDELSSKEIESQRSE